MAGHPAAPVHRGRPGRRLPLRPVDPAGRVLADPDAGQTGLGPDVLRAGHPRQPRHRPPRPGALIFDRRLMRRGPRHTPGPSVRPEGTGGLSRRGNRDRRPALGSRCCRWRFVKCRTWRRPVSSHPEGCGSLGLHVVWCPKYCRRILGGRVAARCSELLEQITSARLADRRQRSHARSRALIRPCRANRCASAGGAGVQRLHLTGGACRVPVSAAVRQGVVVAVVFCRLGRIRLWDNGAPLHRAPVGPGERG